jgi:hypothetical protein
MSDELLGAKTLSGRHAFYALAVQAVSKVAQGGEAHERGRS